MTAVPVSPLPTVCRVRRTATDTPGQSAVASEPSTGSRSVRARLRSAWLTRERGVSRRGLTMDSQMSLPVPISGMLETAALKVAASSGSGSAMPVSRASSMARRAKVRPLTGSRREISSKNQAQLAREESPHLRMASSFQAVPRSAADRPRAIWAAS